MVTQRSGDTRERILQAASKAVLLAGAGGLRVDSVAQAAMANKRMIYHYFGGKEGLIRAVYELHAQKLNAKSNGLSEESRQIFTRLLGEIGVVPENQAMVSPAELSEAMQVLLPVMMRSEAEVASMMDISSTQWQMFGADVMNMMFAGLSAKAGSTTHNKPHNKPRYRMASTSRLR